MTIPLDAEPTDAEPTPLLPEQLALLRGAKRCRWMAWGCLLMLPLLIATDSWPRANLPRLLDVPRRAVELGLVVNFVSWFLLGFYLFLHAGHLKLAARAVSPAQKRALDRVRPLDFACAACFLLSLITQAGAPQSRVLSQTTGLSVVLIVVLSVSLFLGFQCGFRFFLSRSSKLILEFLPPLEIERPSPLMQFLAKPLAWPRINRVARPRVAWPRINRVARARDDGPKEVQTILSSTRRD